MTSVTLVLLHTWRSFIDLGDNGCFHWDEWALVSRSRPWTHVSSPVIMISRYSRMALQEFEQIFSHFITNTLLLLWHFAASQYMPKSCVKMACAESWMMNSSPISCTVKRRSFIMSLLTLLLLLIISLKHVDSQTDRKSLSNDPRPSLNLSYYSLMCVMFNTLSWKACCIFQIDSSCVFCCLSPAFGKIWCSSVVQIETFHRGRIFCQRLHFSVSISINLVTE